MGAQLAKGGRPPTTARDFAFQASTSGLTNGFRASLHVAYDVRTINVGWYQPDLWPSHLLFEIPIVMA